MQAPIPNADAKFIVRLVICKSAYPDRWARHVVLGATGPDAQLASELEETSLIAKARGGYAAEASLLIEAAKLTDALEPKSARLLRAAAATLKSGDHSHTMALLDLAQPLLSKQPYCEHSSYALVSERRSPWGASGGGSSLSSLGHQSDS
jgi:hypothetical protein